MVITKPVELAEAEHILSLCERFHKLPSEVMKESTALLRMLDIRAAGVPPTPAFTTEASDA